MRLPTFAWRTPRTSAEAARVLHEEGPTAALLAGGTDLLPNMKRRHQVPATLVSLSGCADLRGVQANGSLRIGAGESLRALERHEALKARLPALHHAITQISTPILRNMGTIGGNVCLDTRCNYYNQNWEWRRAIDFCLKCEGDVCWTAPSSSICWAVNSSDTVPVLVAMGARVSLLGAAGERTIPILELFGEDGIQYLTKRPDEVLTAIEVPPQEGWRSVYRKVRRRGAFDFPVAAVAVSLRLERGVVADARIVLNAVGPKPLVCADAQSFLAGKEPTPEVVEEAAARASRLAKPLDNTDHLAMWRRQVLRVHTRRALSEAAR
jgi:4-hydroxybenzoyl-CoA reductase subunit beta